MQDIDKLIKQLNIFYNQAISYILQNLNEFIIGSVIASIAVVIISMLYVLVLPNQKPTKIKAKHKPKKIKYTKEFLKGVRGIDLDLKK